MPDHEKTAQEKLQKLAKRLRQGWAVRYPVSEKTLEAVRQVVKQQWEQEQRQGQGPRAVNLPPRTRNNANRARRNRSSNRPPRPSLRRNRANNRTIKIGGTAINERGAPHSGILPRPTYRVRLGVADVGALITHRKSPRHRCGKRFGEITAMGGHGRTPGEMCWRLRSAKSPGKPGW